MKVILLPGNGPDNREWIEKVVNSLKEHPIEIIPLEYDHWNEETDKILNLDKELNKLTSIANKIESEYIIFAKTAGVALTLRGIYEGKINPKKCVFLGVPLVWSRLNNFSIDDWFFNYEHETLFIQKNGDPDFYYDELKQYLEGKSLRNYEILKIDGNDKKYNECETMKKHIGNYLNNILNTIDNQ